MFRSNNIFSLKSVGNPFLLIFLCLCVSCEEDLDIAEWKEIPVVYGIINIKDTAQYVRINRTYLSSDDPQPYTQVNDSVNYPFDAFEVCLEEYNNGNLLGDPIYYEPIDRQKEPGMFSNETNCVYKMNIPIDSKNEYILRVTDRQSGKEVWGKAGVLGGVTMEEAFDWERAFYRVNYYAEPLPEYQGSLDPYDHEHYIVRFLYWEYEGGKTYYKYVDWVPGFNPLKDFHDDDTTHQLFDAYFEYLSEQIPIDPTIKRRARGVDYMLGLPGPELQNFIQVYEQPTNPHFFPDYSNMHEGFGIFGSKYFYTYFGLKLKSSTVDTISWGRYLINHRFSDSRGEWH